jgi:hypothetical protein
VKGTLIDTALEMTSRPAAVVRGFLSGAASANIFRRDAPLCGSGLQDAGKKRTRPSPGDDGEGRVS